ncbi:VOC family protein [Sphingobium nicotianae]|uniref:VOC family protein n=1 Tax=Sphingobium nicotianae TaxID=2782607 RepID=A0A9X1IS15_9SPHN|nr:VOC family protein [Sphingobium nicotianae]MBT2187947.1 VOC family protein [Sphingobium nicotianae]
MASVAIDDALKIEALRTLKFAVSDCDKSLAFYEKTFFAQRIAAADHRDADGNIYAYICQVPGLGTALDLRLLPAHAAAAKKFDVISLVVPTRDNLEAWVKHLDAVGASHSGIIPTRLSWCIVVEDPDGRKIKIFARQGHGPEVESDMENPWFDN